MPDLAISAQDFTVTRGGGRKAVETLHSLSFDVRRGEIMGLLGPSGCGKTTLMRSIVGVQKYHGRLDVLGKRAGDKSLRGRIGYMTQSPSIYPDLTVGENLEYFARLCRPQLKRASINDHIGEVLSMLSMEKFRDRNATELSGGQKGRVSLGCALIADPELLVLDEPTVGLDPVTRDDIWTHLKKIASQGTTLLISSHVMDEASKCDRMVLMREGNILRQTTASDLLKDTKRDNLEEAFLEVIRHQNQYADA